MCKYDKEYYFLVKPISREDLPTLMPDENTATRRFRFEAQPFGSPPLSFFNGAEDSQKRRGINIVKVPPKILFSGSNLVIDDSTREKLVQYEIPDMHLHPATYVHKDKNWYEGYWYVTFAEEFDCWDRDRSLYCPDPVSFEGIDAYEVGEYSLNEEVLDKTPLEQRLLFKMGGTTAGLIVCHESIISAFPVGVESGLQIISVSKFGRE